MTSKITLVLGLLSIFMAGYLLGMRKGDQAQRQVLLAEVAGVLEFHIEAATLIRLGRPETGLAMLDSGIDAAILSLESKSNSLRVAKVYRRLFPTDGERRVAIDTTLSPVEEADPRSCGPALRQLMGVR